MDGLDGRRPVQLTSISYYVAPRDSKGNPEEPQLVMIFGWFGAGLSQLLKYSSKYANLYPSASQVIIQADILSILGETVNVNRQLEIIEKLNQFGLFNGTAPRTFIHVFSNGGASQLFWFALALESRPLKYAVHTPPSTCLVLDSSPGGFRKGDLERGLILYHKATGFRKLAISVFISLLHMGLKTSSIFFGTRAMHDLVREGLNNPRLLPWMDATMPRLYVYSDADEQSLVSDVEEHIEAAKKKGLSVREEHFSGSQHVRHLKTDPDRYWGAVRCVWGDAVRSKL
ncbi:hypothetical protein B0H11DRAFT_2069874 [Mycena galericulata]|nr:hypothetical protein B0H11DRAFT_2069874 [Mycena galericulata]